MSAMSANNPKRTSKTSSSQACAGHS